MAIYIGFNTQNIEKSTIRTDLQSGADGGTGSLSLPLQSGKKFRLVDNNLVIQDFINALNIPQGQKPGNPAYGTTLWSFVFDPNTADTQEQLETEIRRVASLDPRLILNSVIAYPQESGILIELELAISPFNNVLNLQVFFDQGTNTATTASFTS
jgi:phage baseplate assembly protein W